MKEKKYNYKYPAVITLLLLFVVISSCQNGQEQINSTTGVDTNEALANLRIDDDLLLISLENAYYHFTEESYERGMSFDLVLHERVDPSTISILFPDDVHFTYDIVENDFDILPITYNEFLALENFDWEEASILALNAVDNRDELDAYNEYYNWKEDEFESFDGDVIKDDIGYYTANIQFDLSQLNDVIRINRMQIGYADKLQEFDIGNIVLDPRIPVLDLEDQPLDQLRITASGKQALPNFNEVLLLSDCSFEALQDITIISFEADYPDLSIVDVNVVVNTNDNYNQRQFNEDQGLAIEAHSRFQPVIQFNHPGLGEQVLTNLIASFTMTYETTDGSRFQTKLTSSYRTKLTANELVIHNLEGNSLFEYFYEYYSKLSDEIYGYDIIV